jgi:hypothetical protein
MKLSKESIYDIFAAIGLGLALCIGLLEWFDILTK